MKNKWLAWTWVLLLSALYTQGAFATCGPGECNATIANADCSSATLPLLPGQPLYITAQCNATCYEPPTPDDPNPTPTVIRSDPATVITLSGPVSGSFTNLGPVCGTSDDLLHFPPALVEGSYSLDAPPGVFGINNGGSNFPFTVGDGVVVTGECDATTTEPCLAYTQEEGFNRGFETFTSPPACPDPLPPFPTPTPTPFPPPTDCTVDVDYIFKVVYYNPDNLAPEAVNFCRSNGSPCTTNMAVDSGAVDPLLRDGNYSNGEQYRYSFVDQDPAYPEPFGVFSGVDLDYRFEGTAPGPITMKLPPWGLIYGTRIISEVPPADCSSEINPESYYGVVGQPVQFDASNNPWYGDYGWAFGDATGGAGINPTHVYSAPGTYVVQITSAPAACFGSSAFAGTATITAAEEPTNYITVTPENPTTQDIVTLSYTFEEYSESCGPDTLAATVVGNDITLTVIPSPLLCPEVLLTDPISVTLETTVSNLTAGDYNVSGNHNDVPTSTTFTVSPVATGSFDVPVVVGADASGAFSYQAVYTPAAPVRIATWSYWNVDNTNVAGLVADGFCFPGMEVSDQPTIIPISGSLLNLSQPGTVAISLSTCSGESYTVETTITPYIQRNPITVSPANPTEWDSISLAYSVLLPTPCTELQTSYSITGNTIRLDARYMTIPQPPVVCIQVIDDRNVVENIGTLPAGSYSVELYIDDTLRGVTAFEVTPVVATPTPTPTPTVTPTPTPTPDDKVTLCHKGKETIEVAYPSAEYAYHKKHNDPDGACPNEGKGGGKGNGKGSGKGGTGGKGK